MPQKMFLLLFFTIHLFSYELSSVYYVNSKNIQLQDIIPSAKPDISLYKINKYKYTKKVKTKNLIALLNQHGFNLLQSSSRYIRFIQKSPIDTSDIKLILIKNYKEHYPDIKINSVLIMPRGFIKSLAKKFQVSLHQKAYLSKEGTLSIKSIDNKKLFFDYLIDANLYVYTSKIKLHRDDRISTLNTMKKSIIFDKFRALPINISHLNTSQAKRNLKAGKILTIRDIQSLDLVKKNAHVSVSLKNGNINISFFAKALQNGKLQDIITAQKTNRQKIRVRIIGKNMVELK